MRLPVSAEIDLTRKIKLYIASRFRNKELIKEIKKTIPTYFEVVSTWHELSDANDGTRAEAIMRDLSELDSCDAILVITENCENVPGGMHFEAGYAYGTGKEMFLLGPAVHIFYDLAEKWPF